MSMFCYQCQETAGNHGCSKAGVCGKTSDVSNLQDLLIFVTKGLSYYALQAKKMGLSLPMRINTLLTVFLRQ